MAQIMLHFICIWCVMVIKNNDEKIEFFFHMKIKINFWALYFSQPHPEDRIFMTK